MKLLNIDMTWRYCSASLPGLTSDLKQIVKEFPNFPHDAYNRVIREQWAKIEGLVAFRQQILEPYQQQARDWWKVNRGGCEVQLRWAKAIHNAFEISQVRTGLTALVQSVMTAEESERLRREMMILEQYESIIHEARKELEAYTNPADPCPKSVQKVLEMKLPVGILCE